MWKPYLFTVVTCLLPMCAVGKYDTEKKLRKELNLGYDRQVRPSRHFTTATVVQFDMAVSDINELSVKDEVLNLFTYTTLQWLDPQLSWNSSQYDGITETVFTREEIWTPDVVLFNTGEQSRPPLSHMELYKTKVNVHSGGNCIWLAPTNWIASCESDIQYFPFDVQVCTMRFGSWSYNSKRLKVFKSPAMDKSSHVLGSDGISSGQWKITGYTIAMENKTLRCCSSVFATVKMTFTVQRLALYFVIYNMIPIITLIALHLLIFHLDFGQRASYGVTILLALSVYMLVLSDSLPEKSDNNPLIGITFVIEYLLMCLSIPLAQYSGAIAERTGGPPPAGWMMKLVSCCLCGRGDKIGSTEIVSVELEGMDDGVKVEAIQRQLEEDYSKQWKRVGRCLDTIFSIAYVCIAIILPVIVGEALAS